GEAEQRHKSGVTAGAGSPGTSRSLFSPAFFAGIFHPLWGRRQSGRVKRDADRLALVSLRHATSPLNPPAGHHDALYLSPPFGCGDSRVRKGGEACRRSLVSPDSSCSSWDCPWRRTTPSSLKGRSSRNSGATANSPKGQPTVLMPAFTSATLAIGSC